RDSRCHCCSAPIRSCSACSCSASCSRRMPALRAASPAAPACAPRSAADRLSAASERSLRRPLVRPVPEVDLVAVGVLDDERRLSPLHALGLDALLLDVIEHHRDLVVIQADVDTTVSGPVPRAVLVPHLIEDQLEAEQAHLTDIGFALALVVPVLREAEFLLVETQGALGV